MEIKSANFVISSPKVDMCPDADRPEFAFIGRSNVGKSSLINMLTNKKNLAKTSSTPGKTQLINHFMINDQWYLVDLPGYGYAKVAKTKRRTWTGMIKNYLLQRENLANLFVLIDSRHSPQKLDLDFVNSLGAWGIPFTIVFTKIDKIKQREVSKNIKNFKSELLKDWEELPPIFETSAVKGTGKMKILEFVEDVLQEIEDNPIDLASDLS